MRLPLLPPTMLCCRLLFLVLLLAIGTTVALAEKLPIKSYTSAEGLAGEYIECIVPDSHGFLWFCTPEGLSRFDGYNFVNYGRSEGLPQGSVLDLLEAHDGTYWVATTNGICRFDLFTAKEESNNQNANAQAFGVLPSSPQFVCYRPNGNAKVNAISEDHDRTLWCGTDDGLFELKRSKDALNFIRTEIGMPSGPEGISTMLVDRSGRGAAGAWTFTAKRKE